MPCITALSAVVKLLIVTGCRNHSIAGKFGEFAES
jgi:hypothetical protein